jgi:hypothetical protein
MKVSAIEAGWANNPKVTVSNPAPLPKIHIAPPEAVLFYSGQLGKGLYFVLS